MKSQSGRANSCMPRRMRRITRWLMVDRRDGRKRRRVAFESGPVLDRIHEVQPALGFCVRHGRLPQRTRPTVARQNYAVCAAAYRCLWTDVDKVTSLAT